MGITLVANDYYLPEKVLTNEDLAQIYSQWPADKILKKTGIHQRHISGESETVSDMAEKAANSMFEKYNINRKQIDFILFATQSPDFFLPTTACVLQDRLGLLKNIGAFDFNLGCSAYIYGLAMAKSFILSKIASNVLLITSEMYTKHIHIMDKSTRTVFGDAASSTLLSEGDGEIFDFTFGTDGSGANNLIIPAGGMRLPKNAATSVEQTDTFGSIRSQNNLYMNGSEIFNFTIDVVPRCVEDVLKKNSLTMDDIDLFIFHQANDFMLTHLRKKLGIAFDKFYVSMSDIGNTVSSTIPIAIHRAEVDGILKRGHTVMLVGFGVGYSWGATIIKY